MIGQWWKTRGSDKKTFRERQKPNGAVLHRTNPAEIVAAREDQGLDHDAISIFVGRKSEKKCILNILRGFHHFLGSFSSCFPIKIHSRGTNDDSSKVRPELLSASSKDQCRFPSSRLAISPVGLVFREETRYGITRVLNHRSGPGPSSVHTKKT